MVGLYHVVTFNQDGSKVTCGHLHPDGGTEAKMVASHIVLLGMEKTQISVK